MSTSKLQFRPNDKESIFFEDNNINFTDWCHAHAEKDMGNHKFIRFDKFQMPFTMILIGLLILIIGVSNIFNQLILLFCSVFSMFAVAFGIFSIIGVIKNG